MQYKWRIFRDNGQTKFKINEPKDDSAVNLIIYRIKSKNSDDVKFAIHNVYENIHKPNYWLNQSDQIDKYL